MQGETPKRHYKVEVGDVVTVKRQDVREYTFYKIALSKKMYDGTKAYFDKNIAFPKGTDMQDGTKIRILDFFEDVFARPNDKYNANWTLFIKEWEVVEDESTNDAISEFNDIIDANNSIVTDEDIAF